MIEQKHPSPGGEGCYGQSNGKVLALPFGCRESPPTYYTTVVKFPLLLLLGIQTPVQIFHRLNIVITEVFLQRS